jgi:hypothetical protein
MQPGLRVVCVREFQESLRDSAKRLIEDKIQGLGVDYLFRVLYDRIETPGGGVIIFQGMHDSTAESIRSGGRTGESSCRFDLRTGQDQVGKLKPENNLKAGCGIAWSLAESREWRLNYFKLEVFICSR